MDMPSQDNERYLRAKARVDALRAFYRHLATYLVIIGVLFVIDLATGDDWWFYWAAFGWGIGIAWHAFSVFGPQRRFGEDWERRKIQEEMEKDARR